MEIVRKHKEGEYIVTEYDNGFKVKEIDQAEKPQAILAKSPIEEIREDIANIKASIADIKAAVEPG